MLTEILNYVHHSVCMYIRVLSLSDFCIRVMLSLQNELESIPFYYIFWKSLGKTGLKALNIW